MDATPLRIAVVGAGPAGFYAAEKLLKAGHAVTLLDRLPTPWGLVRAGVAPDHPNIKAVTRVYEKTAAMPGFAFAGGVAVGRDLTHEDLLAHHHAVLYATGASRDRRLGIPGEDRGGSIAATDFVAWYNGHPDACDLEFDLRGPRAVVVGNGNVALDVARMLVLTRDELACTDVADHALDVLSEHTIEEVVVLGRRGPAQAAFTTPELRELGELTEADVVVDPADLEGAEAEGTTAKRNLDVLRDYAAREPAGKPRRVVLRFFASPLEVLGGEHTEAVRIGRNRLEDGRAVPTGEEELLEATLVVRSVGYLGVPLPGLPFDERTGTVPNGAGRVTGMPGTYVAGWIKRGPSGVIGTNKKDANETVAALLEDAEAGALPEPGADAEAFAALLAERAPDAVDYAGWQRIDEHERAAGEPQGRPRVKLTRMEELREISRRSLTG